MFGSKEIYRFLALSAMAAVLVVIVAFGAVGQQPASAPGYYTDAQADRGSATFEAKCQTCHGSDLLGGVAPALAGPNFMMTWSKRNTTDLFTRIHEGMPINNPGTLSDDEVADVVAFILQTNGAPAGTKEFTPTTKVGIGVATAATEQPKAGPSGGSTKTEPAGGTTQTAPSSQPSQDNAKQAQPSKESGAKPAQGETK